MQNPDNRSDLAAEAVMNFVPLCLTVTMNSWPWASAFLRRVLPAAKAMQPLTAIDLQTAAD